MISSWEGKHPKLLSEFISAETLIRNLLTDTRCISKKNDMCLPIVKPHRKLTSALAHSFNNGALLRGLEEIQKSLLREAAGLKKLAEKDESSSPKRISKLIIISVDGSTRFNDDIATLLIKHAPRTAGLILDCSAADLSLFLNGKTGNVKAVLANNKNALNLILTTLGNIMNDDRRTPQ